MNNNTDINLLWEVVKQKLSSSPKISAIAFTIYFNDLKPYTVRGNTLILLASLEAHRKYINTAFRKQLLEALKEADSPYDDYAIILKDEADNIEPMETVQVIPSDVYQDSIPFTKEYTFDTFVVGDSNKLAAMTCLAIAENPGDIYNPLFIYSRPGLGKTHLLNAIGNYLISHNPGLKVLYITAENFTNDYIYSIRNNKNADFIKLFNEKYRNQDVLMLDDVQFLEKAEKTQEALFHIFNDLFAKKKQIIISSDRPIKNLTFFDERLSSRFASGITVNIETPSFEDRVAILQKKTYAYRFQISRDVMYFLADIERTNIRVLEGMLKTVGMYSRLVNKPADSVDFAKEALRDTVNNSEDSITIERIMEATASYFNKTVEELTVPSRASEILVPRQYAMYVITMMMPNIPLSTIGKYFHKEHTTVMHARDKVERLMQTDEKAKIIVDDIKNLVLNK